MCLERKLFLTNSEVKTEFVNFKIQCIGRFNCYRFANPEIKEKATKELLKRKSRHGFPLKVCAQSMTHFGMHLFATFRCECSGLVFISSRNLMAYRTIREFFENLRNHH